MVTDLLAIRKTLSEAQLRATVIDTKKNNASTTSAAESLSVSSQRHKIQICG